MYKKELKRYFRKMVIRQAEFAKIVGNIDECMWMCLYYLSGLDCGMTITGNYESYVMPFTSTSFGYIFRSLVELKKGGE